MLNKSEYIDIIEKGLIGRISDQDRKETVDYYRDYIDMEIRKGKTEEEVLGELGNPRLLVKSIVMAKEQKDNKMDSETGAYESEKENRRQKMRSFHIPMFVIVLIVVLVFFLFIGLALSLVKVLLPIVLPILLIFWGISLFRKRK